MIYGITNDEHGASIQRLSVSTKLSIGLPPANDKSGPQKLDHFIFLQKPEDGKGTDWVPDKELSERYGKAKSVDVIFLDDELENVFPTKLAWWTASQLKCSGNGAEAVRKTEKNPHGGPYGPCGPACEDYQKKRCKPSGDLLFMLADFPRLGTVCRIHTTSYRSIRQIHSALKQIQNITGGRLAGIRARLVVRPEKSSYIGKDGKPKSTTIYALSLEMKANDIKKLVGNMTENARLFETTRKMLGGTRVQVMEDEGALAGELSKEFYEAEDTRVTDRSQEETFDQTPQPPAVGQDGFVTAERRTEIFRLASSAGVNQGDLVQYLRENTDCESTSKMTPAAAETLAEWLEGLIEAEAKQ